MKIWHFVGLSFGAAIGWTLFGSVGLNGSSEEETTLTKSNRGGGIGDVERLEHRSCSWDQEKPKHCQDMLIRYLRAQSRASKLSLAGLRWEFLGDSTMKRAFVQLISHFNESKKLREERGICGQNDFLGLPKAAEWSPPRDYEGPLHFGLAHPSCTDCKGCASVSYQIDGSYNGTGLEFISVEFSRDVEIQTPTTRTTQESAALYLKNDAPSGAICVINEGLHDSSNANLTQAGFVDNVHFMFDALKGSCKIYIWLGISSVREDPNYPQNNIVLKGWTDGVAETTTAFIVDVWNQTLISDHDDNVHLDAAYYSGLAALFAHAIKTVSWPGR